jgi:flagellar basal-body rod protein FlgB
MPLLDTTQLALEAAMRGASLRQTLLTNNIANADTPGYQRQDVDFQSTLRSAMASADDSSGAGDSSASALADLQFQPVTQTGAAGAAGNGVNIDQESALIAENGLDYQALTQVLGARDSIMRSAMGAA